MDQQVHSYPEGMPPTWSHNVGAGVVDCCGATASTEARLGASPELGVVDRCRQLRQQQQRQQQRRPCAEHRASAPL
eukprot:5396942-Pleurochrysis_carterae.AAC.3